MSNCRIRPIASTCVAGGYRDMCRTSKSRRSRCSLLRILPSIPLERILSGYVVPSISSWASAYPNQSTASSVAEDRRLKMIADFLTGQPQAIAPLETCPKQSNSPTHSESELHRREALRTHNTYAIRQKSSRWRSLNPLYSCTRATPLLAAPIFAQPVYMKLPAFGSLVAVKLSIRLNG